MGSLPAMTESAPANAAGTLTIGGDLTVNRLGFGAMRITGKGVWGDPQDPDTARAVLRRAIELGVNLVDTADSYGPEVSELLIAEALHPYPDDLAIATKAGLTRRGPNEWGRDGRPEHLMQACEGSLRRLKLDSIDLYQLHAPDPKVPYEESIGAMAELQRAGKVRHIGISNVSVEQLEQARGIVEVASVQNSYSIASRESDPLLAACERHGLAFFPWYPLGAGMALQIGGELDRVAGAHGATKAQILLAWILHRSPAIVPIPGTSSVAHLEENVAAAALKLSDEEMAALDSVRRPLWRRVAGRLRRR
jgi:pyridoxine 4-dehydrogenase